MNAFTRIAALERAIANRADTDDRREPWPASRYDEIQAVLDEMPPATDDEIALLTAADSRQRNIP